MESGIRRSENRRSENRRSGQRGLAGGAWWGVLQTLGIVALFVAGGLSWAVAEGWAVEAAPAYAGETMPPTAPTSCNDLDIAGEAKEIWLVDGFNVVQVALLRGRERAGWWRESRRRELVARANAFDDPHTRIWLVWDGGQPGPEGASDETVREIFAPSADSWLLARLREAREPGPIRVVTADRRLAARARHRGATVVSPHEFLARCTR